MADEITKKRNYCSRCMQQTNHHVLYKVSEGDDDENSPYSWEYMIVTCCGCEKVSYRTDFHDYEDAYIGQDDEWHHSVTTTIYPSVLKQHKALSDTHVLPEKIQVVYSESIKAFKAGCHLLTGAGFRAVIEAVCLDKQIPGRNLEIKINNLAKSRLITDKEAERLHSIRFIGNDSVHEMAVPKERALYIVLDIIEHLLKNLYLFDHKAKRQLETVIKEFPDFLTLLNSELKSFTAGDEFPLAKYLGKKVRRLNGQIGQFESDLIKEITNGSYQTLKIGKIDTFGNSQNKHQHFIIA